LRPLPPPPKKKKKKKYMKIKKSSQCQHFFFSFFLSYGSRKLSSLSQPNSTSTGVGA
jgi:hypothetical protein